MSTAVALPTGSLYELTDHLQALFDTAEMIEDPALKAESEADIQRYLEAEVRKVDGINGYLNQCEAQQAAAKAEIERLQARKQTWERREERIREYVLGVMERFGERKLEGRTATFSLRAAPSSVVIVNDQEIPDEFKKTVVSVSIDKAAVKKAINSGRDVPGADLAIGKNSLVRK